MQKKNRSFDITEAIQEGMNEFHKSCGYKITDALKCINSVQTSNKPRLNVLLKFILNILIVFRNKIGIKKILIAMQKKNLFFTLLTVFVISIFLSNCKKSTDTPAPDCKIVSAIAETILQLPSPTMLREN